MKIIYQKNNLCIKFIVILSVFILSGCDQFLKGGDTLKLITPEIPTTVEGYVYLYYPNCPVSDIDVTLYVSGGDDLYGETTGDGYFMFSTLGNPYRIRVENPYGSNSYVDLDFDGQLNYGPVIIYINHNDYDPEIIYPEHGMVFIENETININWLDVANGGYVLRLSDTYGSHFTSLEYDILGNSFDLNLPSVSSNQSAYLKVTSNSTGNWDRITITIQNQ